MTFAALSTFATWSSSRRTAEKLLDSLLEEVSLCLTPPAPHALHPPGHTGIGSDDADDDLWLCDQNALDLIVALVAQDDVLRHPCVRERAAGILNKVVDELSDVHLEELDQYVASCFLDPEGTDDGPPSSPTVLLSEKLITRVTQLAKKTWHALVHKVMNTAQPSPSEWSSFLVAASGLVLPGQPLLDHSSENGGLQSERSSTIDAASSSVMIRYLLGTGSPFQQLSASIEEEIARWGLRECRDELFDSALQHLVDTIADEELLRKAARRAGGIHDDNDPLLQLAGNNTVDCSLIASSLERQRRAEYMLLVMQCNEESTEGDAIRAALGITFGALRDDDEQRASDETEYVGMTLDPLSITLSSACVRTLQCAASQLRLVLNIFLCAEQCQNETKDEPTSALSVGLVENEASPARGRLMKLLEWFGRCHGGDHVMFSRSKLTLSSLRANSAASSASIYKSKTFASCLCLLCEGISTASADVPPPRKVMTLRFKPPQRFVQLASFLPAATHLLPPSQRVSYQESGIALLCSTFFLLMCVNRHLACHASWFSRTIPRLYLMHPIVVEAARGFMSRKGEGQFASCEMSILLDGVEGPSEGEMVPQQEDSVFWTASCIAGGGGGD